MPHIMETSSNQPKPIEPVTEWLKQMVQDAGAEWVGIQYPLTSLDIDVATFVMFTDPENPPHAMLALSVGECTPENIRRKLGEHKKPDKSEYVRVRREDLFHFVEKLMVYGSLAEDLARELENLIEEK